MLIVLTLAGGDVRGLLETSNSNNDVICLSSTGSVAILLELMSSATSFSKVSSEIKANCFFTDSSQ